LSVALVGARPLLRKRTIFTDLKRVNFASGTRLYKDEPIFVPNDFEHVSTRQLSGDHNYERQRLN
jgi:hypothetical protein